MDYLQAKTLKHGEWHEEASAILKRSGISDDLSLFIAMENTYNEFINEKRKQANGK